MGGADTRANPSANPCDVPALDLVVHWFGCSNTLRVPPVAPLLVLVPAAVVAALEGSVEVDRAPAAAAAADINSV